MGQDWEGGGHKKLCGCLWCSLMTKILKDYPWRDGRSHHHMVDKTLAVESDRTEGQVGGDPGTDSW